MKEFRCTNNFSKPKSSWLQNISRTFSQLYLTKTLFKFDEQYVFKLRFEKQLTQCRYMHNIAFFHVMNTPITFGNVCMVLRFVEIKFYPAQMIFIVEFYIWCLIVPSFFPNSLCLSFIYAIHNNIQDFTIVLISKFGIYTIIHVM